MLKVVIADDEQRVCQLVQMLADWEALDMEVVATAANGMEALERVERLAPDILITDIRMPGCNGLELIERAKALRPSIEIVIISGYAYFEYAQKALRFGVGEYLLKPIKKDALMGALEKLGARCRAREASSAMVEDLHRDSRQSLQLLQGRLVADLLQNELDAPTVDSLRSKYHVEFAEGLVQLYLLKLDYDPDRLSAASVDIVQQKARELLEGELSPLCGVALLGFRDGVGCGVINYPEAQCDKVRHALRHCLNQLEAQKFLYGSVAFSLALSAAVDDVGRLPACLEEAESALAERLIEGTGRLLETVPPASALRMQQLLDKYHRSVVHAVEARSDDDADNAARALEADATAVPDVRGRELLELTLAAGKLFLLSVDNLADEDRLLRDFRRRCTACSRVSDLFACLGRLQRAQLEQLAQKEDEAGRPIRIAKQYIQQNYSRPITLEDVCAATGFSVSYFSTMFKKETGEGFNKYLTRTRIERAKALLQETDLPVAEVCHQVGYSDLKHFTTTFKKMTSLSPGQYRRLYG